MKGIEVDYEINFNIFQYFWNKTLKNVDPLNEAINYGSTSLNFKQFNEYTGRVNNYLYDKLKRILESKNQKHNIIGIHLKPDEKTIPILLAIHSLSLSYLPIDPQLPNERMEYIINDSKPLCIISNLNDNNRLNEVIQNTDIQLISLNDIFKMNDELIKLDYRSFKQFDSNDLACVLYTSGSTGKPKGVCLSHKSIMNRINWQWNTFEISSINNDIGIFKTSLNFVDHISEIFAFILKGLPLVVVDHESLTKMDRLIDIFYHYKITYFILVPSLLKNILTFVKANNSTNKLKSIKRWVSSGEKLSVDLIDLFFDVYSENDSILSNFYGSTEVTADITFISFKSSKDYKKILFENTNVPIGKPISNSTVILFDEKMNEIENEKEVGEIYASGLCLANGYLNEDSNTNTSNKFLTINNIRYFKTGDFGFIVDGILYYSGRNDSQIKIRGKRVDLNELEYYSLKINGIQSFVPLIYDFDNENKIIISFYKSNLDLDESTINQIIIENLNKYIYDYMIPSYMFKLDEIPLLYNGKVDKQLLKKLFIEKYFPLVKVNKCDDNNKKDLWENLISEISSITGIDLSKLNKSDCLSLKLHELGISSINAILIYLSIEKINKSMKLDEFLSQNTFSDLLNKIENRKEENVDILFKLNLDQMASNLETHAFCENQDFSLMVLKMFVETFPKKNVIHSAFPQYQHNLLDFYYPLSELLKNSKESFIVYDNTKDKYVGGAYIYDDDTVIQAQTLNDEYYQSFEELIESDKEAVAKTIKQNKKKLLYSSILTTNLDADHIENLILVNYIEDQIIKIATKFGYDAIITVNTNKLTRVMVILTTYFYSF